MWPQIVQKAADLQAAISEGATSFLFTEYKYMGVFMVRSPAAVCAVTGYRPRPAGDTWALSLIELAAHVTTATAPA